MLALTEPSMEICGRQVFGLMVLLKGIEPLCSVNRTEILHWMIEAKLCNRRDSNSRSPSGQEVKSILLLPLNDDCLFKIFNCKLFKVVRNIIIIKLFSIDDKKKIVSMSFIFHGLILHIGAIVGERAFNFYNQIFVF